MNLHKTANYSGGDLHHGGVLSEIRSAESAGNVTSISPSAICAAAFEHDDNSGSGPVHHMLDATEPPGDPVEWRLDVP